MQINNRYDFVLLFDVTDGNPNGDPDAGNMPRTDPETNQGIVTDVCLKRKVRNYIQTAFSNQKGYDIFIKEKAILNDCIALAHEEVKKQDKKSTPELAKQVMCEKYFDIRCFGAVLTTGENAGQVRGPVQFTFARSIDPILPCEHSITRMAVTTKEESEKQKGENRTMGRKANIPYGLYRCHGFIVPSFAKQTNFSCEDLEKFWESLKNMWDIDRSASRGLMQAKKLIVFKHSSELGNAPAHTLFNSIQITQKNGVVAIRKFEDYQIDFDKSLIPQGVEMMELI